MIWAGIACRFFPSVKFFPLITGLGYAFSAKKSKTNVLREIAIWLYRLAISRARGVIFQNSDNETTFRKLKITQEKTKTCVVKGSGVDTNHFGYSPKVRNTESLNFLLIARMLKDKGIAEYIEAAICVRSKFANVRFLLVGPSDPSPNAIDIDGISSQLRSGSGISYRGAVDDVRDVLVECDVFVLPSYHEGMPRSVLEALSIGRPIITTDVAGCRETVVDGENGWLVPAKNSRALADKMIWFVENSNQIDDMGRESRNLAMSVFDVERVNKAIIRFLEEI